MINQTNWYQSFFDGLAIEMWHQAVPEIVTQREIDFITKCIAHSPCAILDVPSGTGRHSLALAAQGYSMTAVDISPANIAKLDSLKQTLPVSTICSDILSLTLPGQYDAAICMGNSFSYFPLQNMIRFAQKVRTVLNPGGKFIINSACVAEDILPNLKPALETQAGDIHFAATNKYREHERLLETTMRFTRQDVVEEKTAYHFIFSVDEVSQILKEAGFTRLSLYSSTEMTDYTPGCGQLYIVAR